LSFDKQPRIVTDVTQDTSKVMKAVNDLIPNQNIVGATLYDTCYLAIEKLMKAAQPKRVMILVSNGLDIESRHGYFELRRFLQQSGILLYSVGIMNIDDAGLSQFGRSLLEEISRLSGGRTYYPVTEVDMNESFERIANELRHQYVIGFRSTRVAKEGKIHKLQVEVKTTDKKQKVKVRAREGY
jgi:Ca-activated chloride channel family protein